MPDVKISAFGWFFFQIFFYQIVANWPYKASETIGQLKTFFLKNQMVFVTELFDLFSKNGCC